MLKRRELLAAMGVAAVGGLASCTPLAAGRSVALPAHPRLFDIRAYGATGDGQTPDTAAINGAINRCTAAGGGLVYVPPGTYLCGTVELKSNVTLYLEAGAIILGSRRSDDFTLIPGPPEHGDMNQRHLIFARDASNITIAGMGVIDGNGPSFWTPKQQPAMNPWGETITHDYAASIRRSSPLVELYNCSNVHLLDIRIQNASGWTLRPIQCTNVFIDHITIKNPIFGPNTDGIDVTCCRNVTISNCVIETGDDTICLKSENPYGGELAVTKNITVTNCVLSSCCNGLKIGTATYGGFENITFSNSVIYNDNVPPKQRIIGAISLEMVDGGYIDGVTISNIRIQRSRAPIFIRRGARKGNTDNRLNYVRGIMIDNILASGSIMTSSVTGLPGSPVEDISLSNIRMESQEAQLGAEIVQQVPEKADSYPEARIFGHLPAHGLYARHVKGLVLHNVELRADERETRSALVCEDVESLNVDSLRCSAVLGNAPAVKLTDTRGAFLRGCQAPLNCAAFLQVAGRQSSRIVLMSSDLISSEKSFVISDGASANAVTEVGNTQAAAAAPTAQRA